MTWSQRSRKRPAKRCRGNNRQRRACSAPLLGQFNARRAAASIARAHVRYKSCGQAREVTGSYSYKTVKEIVVEFVSPPPVPVMVIV